MTYAPSLTLHKRFSDCRIVATPLASLLGVKETARVKATYIPTLESHYCKITKHPTKVDVHGSTQVKKSMFHFLGVRP